MRSPPICCVGPDVDELGGLRTPIELPLTLRTRCDATDCSRDTQALSTARAARLDSHVDVSDAVTPITRYMANLFADGKPSSSRAAFIRRMRGYGGLCPDIPHQAKIAF